MFKKTRLAPMLPNVHRRSTSSNRGGNANNVMNNNIFQRSSSVDSSRLFCRSSKSSNSLYEDPLDKQQKEMDKIEKEIPVKFLQAFKDKAIKKLGLSNLKRKGKVTKENAPKHDKSQQIKPQNKRPLKFRSNKVESSSSSARRRPKSCFLRRKKRKKTTKDDSLLLRTLTEKGTSSESESSSSDQGHYRFSRTSLARVKTVIGAKSTDKSTFNWSRDSLVSLPDADTDMLMKIQQHSKTSKKSKRRSKSRRSTIQGRKSKIVCPKKYMSVDGNSVSTCAGTEDSRNRMSSVVKRAVLTCKNQEEKEQTNSGRSGHRMSFFMGPYDYGQDNSEGDYSNIESIRSGRRSIVDDLRLSGTRRPSRIDVEDEAPRVASAFRASTVPSLFLLLGESTDLKELYGTGIDEVMIKLHCLMNPEEVAEYYRNTNRINFQLMKRDVGFLETEAVKLMNEKIQLFTKKTHFTLNGMNDVETILTNLERMQRKMESDHRKLLKNDALRHLKYRANSNKMFDRQRPKKKTKPFKSRHYRRQQLSGFVQNPMQNSYFIEDTDGYHDVPKTRPRTRTSVHSADSPNEGTNDFFPNINDIPPRPYGDKKKSGNLKIRNLPSFRIGLDINMKDDVVDNELIEMLQDNKKLIIAEVAKTETSSTELESEHALKEQGKKGFFKKIVSKASTGILTSFKH